MAKVPGQRSMISHSRQRTRRRFERLEPRLLLSADSPASSSIQGGVYLLADDGGSRAAVVGAQIELLDEVGQAVAATATDVSGAFTFENLSPGLYAIREFQPAGLIDAGMHVGQGRGQIITDNLIGEIELAPDEVLTGYEFYEAPDVDPIDDGLPPLITHGGSLPQIDNVILRLDSPSPSFAEIAREAPALPIESQPANSIDFEVQTNNVALLDLDRAGSPIATSRPVRRAVIAADSEDFANAAARDGAFSDPADHASGWLQQFFNEVFTWPWSQEDSASTRRNPSQAPEHDVANQHEARPPVERVPAQPPTDAANAETTAPSAPAFNHVAAIQSESIPAQVE